MPENHQQNRLHDRLEALLTPPALYGVLALVCIGVASFFFTAAYVNNLGISGTPHTAAAAATDSFSGIALEGDAAIVVDLQTGQTLFQKNPDAQLPLASLTKVLLALAVAEALDPNDSITIPYDTAPTAGGQRLTSGQTWRVQDVINFTLIASSNEGARILAEAADPVIRARFSQVQIEDKPGAATIWRMNDLAFQLNLTGMYFLNASGLDESETQSGAYGTARSVARLFTYAASTSPEIFAGTAIDGLLMTDDSGNTASAINTNEALGAIPGLIMGKTGYTDLAGGNLAVVFDVGLAHPVVAVVLKSSRDGRFADMKKLVSAARAAIIGE